MNLIFLLLVVHLCSSQADFNQALSRQSSEQLFIYGHIYTVNKDQEWAEAMLVDKGITSICDARTYWKRNHHLIWKRIEKTKVLKTYPKGELIYDR
ncbi:hypothetical protein [Spongiimicrobium sp. 3-5]|uniref:hypothetical protein n=1 Tax=Spongiimicrobium sp. 3-5 TaxID=3332596 RepID=UPI00397EB152